MPKRYRVLLAPKAESDIRAIRAYIARDRPLAADNWRKEVRRQIRSLRQHPLRYELVPELADDDDRYRHVLYGNYRTIYAVEGDVVTILRVLHSAQVFDFSRLSEP